MVSCGWGVLFFLRLQVTMHSKGAQPMFIKAPQCLFFLQFVTPVLGTRRKRKEDQASRLYIQIHLS